MAARCTTPAAAMHHFGGMGAPFQRWPCTIICGQAALLERRTHYVAVNEVESAQIIGIDRWDQIPLDDLIQRVYEKLGCGCVLITLGAKLFYTKA